MASATERFCFSRFEGQLSRAGVERSHAAGTWVVRAQRLEAALLLLEGQAELYRARGDLPERLLGFLRAPCLIWESSLVPPDGSTTSLYAESRCAVLSIPLAAFDELLAAGGELAVRLFHESMQLRARVERNLESWASAETHERLLALFFAQLRPALSASPAIGWAPLVRTRLARVLGVDRKTVARNLARLEDEGYIDERSTSVLLLRDRRARDLGPRARTGDGMSYWLSGTARLRRT